MAARFTSEEAAMVFRYLCLMIPQQLRTHLSNIVMFLERTKDTDEFVSIEQPFFNATKVRGIHREFVPQDACSDTWADGLRVKISKTYSTS